MPARAVRALAVAALLAAPAESQYFGRNRVQYRPLTFAVIETEHFDVYYHEGERTAAIDAARMAERTYARLSRLLTHHYRERQPIILFASHTAFQQNNVADVDEGTGGVTEWLRHRILLPFTGSYADFEHVLSHEIAHQFQIDIFAQGRVGGGVQRLLSVNPPLWFMEGMAEYLALGPITPQTGVWMRDAALDRGLPSLEQLTRDPSYFPYRFGHALWSFVGERWGDRAVADILHAAAVSGVDDAFRRVLGVTLADVVQRWHDATQRTYLPQIADLEQARQVADPILSRRRSRGGLHIAPALSPDGRTVAYLSEGDSYFIDLFLADASTGRVERRLIGSAFSADFESLRFLNSVGSWSPDGRLFAIAVKRGARDDLVLFDVEGRRVHRRITVPLDGLTTPTWSPDGRQLAFTGYDGGQSDLFVINADGSNLRRLTGDRYADLHPAWSPDGRTIAFATDRGPASDLTTLRMAPLAIGLYRLAGGRVEILPGMEGQNLNPQWAPDGRSIAFVSDRTGIPNVFLTDLDDGTTYQLTNLFTGVTSITPLSPAISWAPLADRLVFTYFEGGEFNVYGIDNPRSMRRAPYDPTAPKPMVASLLAPRPDRSIAAAPSPRPFARREDRGAVGDSSRALQRLPTPAAAPDPPGRDDRPTGDAPNPDPPARPTISVRALLDSMAMALPDSVEFGFRQYAVRLSPDYLVEPSIGYVRDNFGGGVYGGSAISLSDMLGNHRLLAAAQVNGRIEEAQVLAVYANLSRRITWSAGIAQTPFFYYSLAQPTTLGFDSLGRATLTTTLERFVVREAFLEAARPFDPFRRIEAALRVRNVGRAAVQYVDAFDLASGIVYARERDAVGLQSANYVQPSVAVVFDNAVGRWVGPFMGRRSRFEYAPAFGDWQFHQVLGDYRRYDTLTRSFTLASRALFFGRFGRDDDEFPLFLGTPDLLRGYTPGSLRKHECLTDVDGSVSGCGALDQLIGSRVAVFNAEIRFPLLRGFALGFAPVAIPPLEGAVFFDAGLAWRDGVDVVVRRDAAANKDLVRQPLTSWGLSIRGTVLGFIVLRADCAKPLARPGRGFQWTLSLGPTF